MDSRNGRTWLAAIAAFVLAGCGKPDGGGGTNTAGSTSGGDNAGGNASGGSAGSTPGGSGGSTGGSAMTGGTGGDSSGGTAGSAGQAPEGMHCAPGAVDTSPFFSGLATSCYGDRFGFGLPNPLDVTISNLALPEPMQPGQPYAISLENSGGAPMTIELWGTDAECGVAQELLWWAEYDSKIQCAEFTPTQAHGHVLFVRRLLEDATNYIVQTSAVALCASGSCPAGADGEGLAPGGELVAPVGGYQRTGGSAFVRGYSMELGGFGNMVLVREGDAVPEGTPQPLAGGFFRMPNDDPFGDAWYCAGEGSTLTELPDNAGMTFSLRNITRLGDCEDGAGTGTASVSIVDFEADITSTFAELAGDAQSASEDCLGTYCRFQFVQTPSYSFLYPTAASDLGNSVQPTGMMADVARAAWFVQTSDGAPIQMTCAAGGAITLAADATTIELTQMSDYASCPGEATAVTEFDGSIY